MQAKDGGWGNDPQSPSTADITGAVLQVLTPGSQAADSALSYLRGEKRPNGGYAPGKTLSANAQATAWVSQGLLAAGKDPAGFGSGSSSLDYLRDLQAPDGKFLQAPGTEASPVWVTAEVIVPLSGRFLPIVAPPREPSSKPATKSKSKSRGSTRGGGEPAATPSPSSIRNSPAVKKFLERASAGATGGTPPPAVIPPRPGKGRGSPAPAPGAGSTGGVAGGLGALGDTSPDARESSEVQYGEQTSEAVGGDSDSDSGTAGAILLGLLAGCVLFGLGLAARRGWMHWRYGM